MQTESSNSTHISPGKRSWLRFKANRRGYYSLWIFSAIFLLSLFAELISNDKPLLVHYQGEYYFPVFNFYKETEFGGDFETEADYQDKYVRDILRRNGNWMLEPFNSFDHTSISYDSTLANPAPPSEFNVLGTDDRGRDVLARLIYGFRLSILFAITLTVIGTGVGIIAGMIQGYFGGRTDLLFQRFIEVWGAMPELYLLIIFASILQPSIWLLIVLLSMFGWMGLSDYVRAEFLRGRNMDYVKSARALGLSDRGIMFRHLLPNSLTPVITFMPFRISGAILALTSLDYLGLGVPPDTPSLGELLSQGKENISAWWLSFTTFGVLVGALMMLIFIGEAVREALDTRRA
ncbi:ABC transporter, permease protein 2 (cluster 5, nickel/peptides/opines) [hydrothermal vent metagenome]|uniref:ABC transporter, permease protein 2 (Cluster 5, nickel/peptides/opines) n=1 Tax=hydrothermal vent metagenome TaxID=652676 RepID=A0A3B0YIB8_9ZZZZ